MTDIKNEQKLEEEVKETERQRDVKTGWIILTTVGIGAGLYGWVNGRISGYENGYRQGRNDGILHTVDNFTDGMRLIIEKASEKSKGK